MTMRLAEFIMELARRNATLQVWKDDRNRRLHLKMATTTATSQIVTGEKAISALEIAYDRTAVVIGDKLEELLRELDILTTPIKPKDV